jgi:hypothetical protein
VGSGLRIGLPRMEQRSCHSVAVAGFHTAIWLG